METLHPCGFFGMAPNDFRVGKLRAMLYLVM
jgi:hypothetical protein